MGNNNLSQAKNELLTKWLQGHLNSHTTTILPRLINSPLPLSLPQQRQLFLELLEPGTAVNNLSIFLQLKGYLDIPALEQSANLIIARHDVLRMSFSFSEGLPGAMVSDHRTISIPVVDLQEIDAEKQVEETKRLAEKEVLQPFNLSNPGLIRLRLYKLKDANNFLLISVHHTIADGWSLGVFLRELMLFYQNITTGYSLNLPELPIQYPDFAYWQNQLIREAVLETSMKYWKEKLSGELPILELPTDHPRTSKQSFNGGTHRFVVSRNLTEALKRLSQQEDVSLFMSLLSCFYIVLHRYSVDDDILIGTPVANRNLPEIENLIGVFINTIVLRADLSGNPSFRQLLKRVRDVSLESYAHQDLPFEKLVEELKPKRDLSRTPIFQVMFNLQNSPIPKMDIPGLNIIPLEIDRGVAQFDLTLMMTPRDGEFDGTVEYNRDLFNGETIKRIFDSFHLLLQDVVMNPENTLSDLKIISEQERYHILYGLNQTQMQFPKNKCVHQLFEEQMKETPDKIAVKHYQNSLTYFELNRRANLLARHLQLVGVRSGMRVGIFMEKSLETVEVLLSIMKVGGTYVPINSSLPAEQVRYILNDANVQVLISNLDTAILEETRVHILNLNEDEIFKNPDSSNLPTDSNLENLAYIIYTSGSTGEPKGVMIPHSALVNLLCSMQQQPGINKDDVLLSITAISFDIAALELFLPLVSGATVVVAGKELSTNPSLFAQTIERYQVSIVQATPASWQIFIESGWLGSPGLKALCGGDVLTRKLADQLLDRVGSLWNMYGPTETTIWSAVNRLQKGNTAISIGTPIANTQMYVLDRYMQPSPPGVAGELFIGGAGLAVGYLNQIQLTSKKFSKDCFSPKPGARLYKTGDMARYLPDHSIEIIGRNDYQVKINGHRIELGEIETMLRKYTAVLDVIVVIRTDHSGGKRLVAYYVAKRDQPVDPCKLQDFLRKKLPAYMIPGVFVLLDEIPLTSNGKINRKALPEPGDTRLPNGYVAPRNADEEMLVEIWQHVLNVKQIGIHDNFFDLGGASIQSLQIVAGANLAGYQLSPETIFEHQTIAQLAEQIKRE